MRAVVCVTTTRVIGTAMAVLAVDASLVRSGRLGSRPLVIVIIIIKVVITVIDASAASGLRPPSILVASGHVGLALLYLHVIFGLACLIGPVAAPV